MKLIKLILSYLYGFVVWLRNALYDDHIFSSHKCKIATICVGNLAVGGTGKTPHTEFLAKELSKKYKIAILSRGYKRRTHGFVLANANSSALTIGDEPMQMLKNLPNVVVAVCENRVEGIKKLLTLYPDLQVVILDDAFQHRKLECGLNILLTAADNLYVEDHFLPYGKLRDICSSALRANVIVVTKCKDDMTPVQRRLLEKKIGPYAYQDVFFSYVKYGSLRSMVEQEADDSENIIDSTKVSKPLILTAIEQPLPMIEYLKRQYPNAVSICFGDHHNLTGRDMIKVGEVFEQNQCDYIITTEKDAARLDANDIYTTQWKEKTVVLPMEVDFKGSEVRLLEIVERYLRENLRTRKNVYHKD